MAEGLRLSGGCGQPLTSNVQRTPTCIHTQCTGIMAVLFNGIVMYGSHDCHMTLSHIAQLTMYRYNGGTVQWDSNVSLHALQPLTRHSSHSTADHENGLLHGR